jgi:anti-sigma factor RsiW
MNCETAKTFLDSYVDGELDLVNHVAFEEHIDSCEVCDRDYQARIALKGAIAADRGLYYRAPADLRRSITASLRENDPEPFYRRWLNWRWTPALATAVLLIAVVATTFLAFRPTANSEDLLAREVVSAHLRSLMLTHLMDVPSTDQHTVKPWFEGKLDFSPPVTDLAEQGFTLIGGRLDYAGGRPVAALVYQRRQHIINLFVSPAQNMPDTANKTSVLQGFNVIHWTRSGMTFWAVSDLNANELQEFAQDLQNH